MSYRLVALDIDGTIRSNEYPISVRTREALDRVRAAGAAVTLATGRMFRSALKATAELNLTSPIVSFQGAHVADPRTHRVLWHLPLTARMARMALDAVAPWGMEVMAYRDSRVYVRELTPRLEGYGERNEVEMRAVGELAGLDDLRFTRLVVVGDPAEVERLDREMNAVFDGRLYVTRSLPHFCEVLNPRGGKDKALEWICRRLEIEPRETIAFGNGYNDVRMLRWAGLGVAIGGAVPEAVAAAGLVAPPIEEDGAAQVLEALLDAGQIG